MKRIFTLTALLCLFMMMGINAAVAQSSNFTATFSYNSESKNLVGSSSPVGVFGNASYTCGTNLSTNGTKTNGDKTKTIFRFKNTDAISKDGYDSKTNGVTFTFYGIAGTTYTPSHIHLEAATSGTDGFSLQIEVSVGGNRKVVATDLGLERIDDSKNLGVSILDYDISGLSASGDVSVILTVNNQGNSDKSVGFNNIELKGTYKNASRQLSVENLDYVGNINSKNNGLDRTTRGLSLDLDGGDGLKYDGKTLNWRYNKAAITFGVDPESIKSSGSDAKIKKFVISTNTNQSDINVKKSDLTLNVPGTIDFVDTYGTGPTKGTGFFIVVTPDDPVESLTVTLNKDVTQASDDTKKSAIAITNFYVDYTYDNGIDLPDNPTIVLPEANENTMVIALNGNSSAIGTAPVPNTSVNNLGGTHNSKNVWSYTVTTADGKATSDVKISGSKVTASKAGEYILTANYTPTASNYFTWGATDDNKETIKLRVIDQAVESKVWIFDKTLANSDNKGIGNGQNFSSDLWSDTKVADLDDKTKTYSAKSFKKTIINDDEPITVDGSTPVYGTDGLRFTTSLTDNLVVIPDHGLRIDENGAIVIRDVMPTVTKTDKTEVPTYILIDARPIEGRAGFKVDRGNSNCDFYNELFTSSTSRQTFMLKVDQSNANAIDVTLFPSSDMEIYKIEVTQKKVPVITPTVTGAGTDTENYTVNNKEKFSVKFNVEGGAKGTVNAYSISQVAEGDAVSSTNGEVTFNGLAAHGGDAVIVAQFVPSSDENIYTYGLSTVVINVSDKTMYRAKKGDQPKVGDWVETVPGIKMQFGGWKGAPDAPAEYRSDGTADKWGKAKKEAYIDTYPGFDYTFSANENSACETQWQYMNPNFSKSSGVPYWYDEKNIPNNPYMMPVFGGFLKFVPSKNGTLEVYIHQNGVICTITRKNGNQEFNPHMMHIRSYYIADETGKLCTDGVTAETLAKPNEIWNGSNGKEGLSTGYGKPSNDPDDKTNYNTDIPFYQKDYDYFKEKYGSEAPSTAQEIYNLQGGWVMLNEGASKYSFHVTAGKTYFVFTNRTKLGFYGFRFTPDENVTEVTIKPSAEDATSYTLTKSPEAAGASVAYKVDQSFKRELNAGMWNTLCLPFSLNEDQTKAALPKGFEIVDFYSVKDDKLTFKKHYYQMIDAGRPYLIWIPGTQGEKHDMKFPAGYVAYDDKTSGSSGLQPINVTGEDDSADKYVWTGTYQQMSLPENAYFVAKNPDAEGHTVMKQNQSGKSWTKGYRAYLVAASGTTPIKSMSLDLDYDGVDENVTTGIDDIIADLTDPQTTGMVYNLGGQLISRNGLQSLPKGIYIMNGKKYVVK